MLQLMAFPVLFINQTYASSSPGETGFAHLVMQVDQIG